MSAKDSPAQIRLDERQHVEKPLLDQLAGLGWEIIDLKQHPGDSYRSNFAEVVMLPVLHDHLLEKTSASENRKTGENNPLVKFIDFKRRNNNRSN
jgi:type I restriction enzyme R subunit